MNLFPSLAALPPDFGPVVATIGNFDGVHRGHTWVIDQVIARSRSLGLRSLAITFDPHPIRVLRPDAPHVLITPTPEKLELLAQTGIDATLLIPFTPELSRLSAREFARQILADACRVQEVHEGENFRFGYQAEAGITGEGGLEALGRELGFSVRAYAPHILRGAPVSSSRIRGLIAEGKLSHARALLGRSFAVKSTPASGRGYGTRYTVPTINLAPYEELLPAKGVYVTRMKVGEGSTAETFQAVTNIGNRPTFGDLNDGQPALTVESHLLDFHPLTLTESTPLELTFLHRLRPEIRWPSPEALRQQIGRDVAKANRFFALAQLLVRGNALIQT
jgi:riboflavin kinase/FMN adenylyltransferase